MYVAADNSFQISPSPHSLGLKNAVTIPSVWDSNPILINQKKFFAAGLSGTDSVSETLSQPIFGIPLWYFIVGGVAYAWIASSYKYTKRMKGL